MPIYRVSEAREGSVINALAEGDSLVLPLRHGKIIPSKPPLYHWLSFFIFRPDRPINEFQLRFVSALAGIGMLALTFFTGQRLLGLNFAIASTTILGTSVGFLNLASSGRVDMLFSFLVCSGIFLWLNAALNAGRDRLIPQRIVYLVSLCFGLSILAKGPVGFVLGVIVCWLISAATQNLTTCYKQVVNPSWIVGLLLALIVAEPWYALAASQGGDAFLERQIVFENILRLIGGSGITIKPFWFYFTHLWGEFIPAVVLITAAIIGLLLKRQFLAPGAIISFFGAADSTESRLAKASLFWLLGGMIFFSIAAGKRQSYLMPLLPAGSILLALICARLASGEAELIRRISLLTALCTPLYLAVYFSIQVVQASNLTFKGISYELAQLIPDTQSVTIVKSPSDESFDVLLFYLNRKVDFQELTKINNPNGLYLFREKDKRALSRYLSHVIYTAERPRDRSQREFENSDKNPERLYLARLNAKLTHAVLTAD